MSGTSTSDQPVFRIPDSEDHERVSALFLGPKAENQALLSQCLNIVVVSKQTEARQAYFPSDQLLAVVGIDSLSI
ncbi:hypothetical protein ACEPAI_8629 [Sanghuangporus weigelae]